MNRMNTSEDPNLTLRRARRFVFSIGVVSLFADATYDSARSIAGPWLQSLGASAAAVGFVSGLGEFLGYAIRLLSGRWIDRTRRYWPAAFIGYAINLAAVPVLALVSAWQGAVALLALERTGRAIRHPARSAMLAAAAARVGHGKAFGFHEAMDQVGALAGPLCVAALLARGTGYRQCFAWLAVPAVCAFVALVLSAVAFPRPQDLEPVATQIETHGWDRRFLLYVLAAGLFAAGFLDFPLLAYHFTAHKLISPRLVPVLYAVAMGVDALAALALGWLFDRTPTFALTIGAAAGALSAPLTLSRDVPLIWAGMILWGVAMGASESVFSAQVARLVPAARRATAFGLFHAVFGAFWFAGSALCGGLYDVNPAVLIGASAALQSAAAALLLWASRPRG